MAQSSKIGTGNKDQDTPADVREIIESLQAVTDNNLRQALAVREKSPRPRRTQPPAKSPTVKSNGKAGDFPLTEHPNGQFCKKRLGKTYYFGKVADGWKAAYAEYQREWPHILEHGCRPTVHATPITTPDAVTLQVLANEFLNAKRERVESGELSGRSFLDYRLTTDRLIAVFGRGQVVADLKPADFQRLRTAIAKGRNPVSVGNEIQRCRIVFKFAFDQELIDKPLRYGQGFQKPTRKTLRLSRNEKVRMHGKRMLTAHELRRILANASQPLRTMVLLAANGGLGQSDLANLHVSNIDLRTGWLNYPRPKTGIDRRIPLWPETVAAIREWLPNNPKPKSADDAGLAFVTKYGGKWVKVSDLRAAVQVGGLDKQAGGAPDDAIGKEFSKLLRKLGMKRTGLSFYAIRHGFETVAGGSLDQVAVDAIMGHADASMAATYREEIADDRLQKVVDHVHAWLWPAGWEQADKLVAEQAEGGENA